MRAIKITDKFSIAGQLALEEFPDLTEAGFTTVVNNRPDGEEAAQPGDAAEAEAAREAGLSYAFIPIGAAGISEADARDLQKALAAAEGPVLAHCKSGMRSLTLYAIAEALDGRLRADEVAAFGARFGFNLAGAKAWLDRYEATR